MQLKTCKRCGRNGFTLAEIVICFAIMGLVIGGMITAYTHSALFAERAGYELAAQAQAVQIMERVRSAPWDTQSYPPKDATTNFPSVTTSILELPVIGSNVVYCTNYTSVSTLINDPSLNVQVKMIQVTTMWPWNGRTLSNTIVTYRAPDQ